MIGRSYWQGDRVRIVNCAESQKQYYSNGDEGVITGGFFAGDSELFFDVKFSTGENLCVGEDEVQRYSPTKGEWE